MTQLADVIIQHIKENRTTLYTSVPAIITDVSDLSNNKVSVQPAIETSLSDGTTYPLPIISDVSIQWPAGGGGVLTFPLKVGDDVLLVFSMKSLAEWEVSSGGTVVPEDLRMHNLSDPIVIPSIFRNSNQPSPDPDNVVLKFGDTSIKINDDGTLSLGNGTQEIVDLLSQLAEQVSLITTNTIYGISPINNKTVVETIKTNIDVLKET